MKICHVAPELLPVPPFRGGAIERWIRDAAVRLAARGHEVHVVSRDHGDGVRGATLDGVRYHFVRIPGWCDKGRGAALLRGPWYFDGVRRRLSGIRPDVVHHHSRPAGLLWARSGAPQAPAVISLHSMDYGWGFGYRGWDRRWYGAGLRASARVLCVSDFIRRHTLERYPDVRQTAVTLYNGVDGATFSPVAGFVPDRPARILYVGRVETRKGVHVLLDAFLSLISVRRPDATLRIVGPHSYWDREPSGYYRDLAERCASDPRIELRGPTYDDHELSAVYRDADVAVVPSTFPEALGLTAIEAQASGLPVIVSDAGGLPETVSPGRSGLVCPSGDAAALGHAVLDLLDDEPRRRAMASAARIWSMERFSWETIASSLERVYEDVRALGAAA
jgi:spore coat protein SA